MSGIKDQKQIEFLRKRLYERHAKPKQVEYHELSPDEHKTSEVWHDPPVDSNIKDVPIGEKAMKEVTDTYSETKKGFRRYRKRLLVIGAWCFVGALVIASIMLLFGSGGVSARNIDLTVTGPFTLLGGESLPLSISITNDNPMSIQSATLIIQYPTGTRSSGEDSRTLTRERLNLETMASGEQREIPIEVLVLGEENEEKTILVSLEYRVQGSNAIFVKEADPFEFRISTPPVSVSVDASSKVAPGQETTISLTVSSNASNPISEVLVRAEYPRGFEFISSDPPPSFGQNRWLLEDIPPEGKSTIEVTGRVAGLVGERNITNFTVGLPSERDKQNMTSIFAKTEADFLIERPFLDVGINFSSASNGVLPPGSQTTVRVTITNTLSYTVYDVRAEGTFGGNAFDSNRVSSSDGFYDSNTETVRWETSNLSSLRSLAPGETRTLSLGITPNSEGVINPQVDVNINVYGNRVAERGASEILVGASTGSVKIHTSPRLMAEVSHGTGMFDDDGPIPPRVGTPTTYTVSMRVSNDRNAIEGARVTTSLPIYVEWMDKVSHPDSLSYNQTDRTVIWDVGSVGIDSAETVSFQVSFTPSSSQIGQTPIILREQNFRATDSFTGTSIQRSNGSLNTNLSTEAGHPSGNGVVR